MENTILTAKERLQQLTLHLDLSVRALAKIVGMSEATLYHITDESLGISARTASKICYELERQRGIRVNREWLLTGEGEMLEGSLMPEAGAEEVPVAAEDLDWQGHDWKDKYYSLLEKYNDLQDRYMALLLEKGQL